MSFNTNSTSKLSPRKFTNGLKINVIKNIDNVIKNNTQL